SAVAGTRLRVNKRTLESTCAASSRGSVSSKPTTATAASWRWSGSSRLGRRPLAIGIWVEKVTDGTGREERLGDEAHRRTRCDQIGKVVLGVDRDQDHIRWRCTTLLAVQPPGHLEPALGAEIDVE